MSQAGRAKPSRFDCVTAERSRRPPRRIAWQGGSRADPGRFDFTVWQSGHVADPQGSPRAPKRRPGLSPSLPRYGLIPDGAVDWRHPNCDGCRVAQVEPSLRTPGRQRKRLGRNRGLARLDRKQSGESSAWALDALPTLLAACTRFACRMQVPVCRSRLAAAGWNEASTLDRPGSPFAPPARAGLA